LRHAAALATFSPRGRYKEAPIRRDMLSLVRQALGDRYAVDREIGRGGAARVFLAQDREGRKVALKILHPELAVSVTAQRFLREISMLSRLQHPHIAQMLDYGELDMLVYYAMRFIEGPNLRVYLQRERRCSLDDAVRHASEMLDALDAAHALGIVHRDVKPENIVLSPEGAVLLDFGIARAVAVSGNERLTRSGFTVGTSAYMSPEQVDGGDLDQRSDIYSLGCVLFECLTGQPPFHDPLEAAVLKMHTQVPAADVRKLRTGIPRPLADAVGKALAKDPGDRWQTARQMLEALRAVKA
jgi:serine/threonine-protein kinase